MESDLRHEDLLIKLRARLNQEKIKLWENPYNVVGDELSHSLLELAKGYAVELLEDEDLIIQGLRELQKHSLDRSKANAEFKESGLATFRVRATIAGEKPKIIKLQKKTNILGSELIASVANEIGVSVDRIKLICNGKVIKHSLTIEDQGIKNGAQLMALIIAAKPEEIKNEDKMYTEMKRTRDDATLLSECPNDLVDDVEYMKLEDQSGRAVELPAAERKALMVGLALHERGRAASKQKDHTLALVFFLEADGILSECRSSILKSVDNWAVLQLDIAWCYLCLQSLSAAADAAARLARAEESFRNSYGENYERLIALKGSAANERVLIMRLFLLQGIVAYHQNKRIEARRLLDKAEIEMRALRVDESAVSALIELGWSRGQARSGLRAAGGDLDRAYHYLADMRRQREEERAKYRTEKQERALGFCLDGSPVNQQFVAELVSLGFDKRNAVLALRISNNLVSDAVRVIQEEPEMLVASDVSSNTTSSPSSEESLVEPDDRLLSELKAMGYEPEQARLALCIARNHMSDAVDLLLACGGQTKDATCSGAGPSTSNEESSEKRLRKALNKVKRSKEEKRIRKREKALQRLKDSIHSEEDDYLDTSLAEEEQFLALYSSLV